tara:strand:+ start:1937 stop:2143 length:207 start_codon:yes stop_codon:yes gene_type:complete
LFKLATEPEISQRLDRDQETIRTERSHRAAVAASVAPEHADALSVSLAAAPARVRRVAEHHEDGQLIL